MAFVSLVGVAAMVAIWHPDPAGDPRLTMSLSCCWKHRGERTGDHGSSAQAHGDSAGFWI
jgi:hypothetical protein